MEMTLHPREEVIQQMIEGLRPNRDDKQLMSILTKAANANYNQKIIAYTEEKRKNAPIFSDKDSFFRYFAEPLGWTVDEMKQWDKEENKGHWTNLGRVWQSPEGQPTIKRFAQPIEESKTNRKRRLTALAADCEKWIKDKDLKTELGSLDEESRVEVFPHYRDQILPFVEKTLALPPETSEFLPKNPSLAVDWGNRRLRIENGQIREWSELLYDNADCLGKEIEKVTARVVQKRFEETRNRLESEGRAFQEDWSV